LIRHNASTESCAAVDSLILWLLGTADSEAVPGGEGQVDVVPGEPPGGDALRGGGASDDKV